MWQVTAVAVVGLALFAFALLSVSRSWTTTTRQMSTEHREAVAAMRTTASQMATLAETLIFGRPNPTPPTGGPETNSTSSAPTPESEIDSIPLPPEILSVMDREAMEDESAGARRQALRDENAFLQSRLDDLARQLSDAGIDPSAHLSAPLRPTA